MEKETQQAIVLTAVITSLYTVAFLIIFLYLAYPMVFSDFAVSLSYGSVASMHRDDKIVNEVAHNCSKLTSQYDQVTCVNQYFRDNFNRNESEHLVYSPDQTFKFGGVCRDSAVAYCSIMSKLNIKCDYVTWPGVHVFNIVWFKDDLYTYCVLDQRDMECF